MAHDPHSIQTGENLHKPGPGYDWDDPHGVHKGSPVDDEGHHHEEHHVTSWQLMVGVLAALLFFTFLTVLVAKGEVILTTYTDFPITQLWNVNIAMSIATIKAMFVCLYFMHLRHDKPLNGMVMLTTIVTLGLFMTFPAIDLANRDLVKPWGGTTEVDGGSGVGMSRWNGEDISGPIVTQAREKKIAELGEDKYWKYFYTNYSHYHHGDVPRHPADEKDVHAKWIAAGGGHHGDDHADTSAADAHGIRAEAPEVSTASRRVIRTGLTPGLFDTTPPLGGDPHQAGEHHTPAPGREDGYTTPGSHDAPHIDPLEDKSYESDPVDEGEVTSEPATLPPDQ